jgi:hypothetical protein
VKAKIEGLSDIESAWNSYHNSETEKLVKMVRTWKNKLSIKEIDDFKKLMVGSWKLRSSYFNLIKDEVFEDFYPKEDLEDGAEE